MQEYEQSLKEKWDWYSSLKTAREETLQETAIKMIETGLNDDVIRECTGLTQEQIDKLRKENQ